MRALGSDVKWQEEGIGVKIGMLVFEMVSYICHGTDI